MKQKAENPIAEAEGFSISSDALLDLMGDVLARGVPFKFKARGSSMTPFVRDGDVITISPLDQGRVGLGMIVAFNYPGRRNLVIHRIVDVAPDEVLIKGDNSPDKPDGWIPNGNLLGHVIEIRRAGRRIWLGLGSERCLIAFFSRRKWIIPLRRAVAVLRGMK